MTRHASFPPVVEQATETLILGSLPGAVSLAAARYYAHPRNQFWALIGAVIGVELGRLSYEARIDVLLRHRVGLWDVIADAERAGSLDAAIRNHAANDLRGLVASLPKLRVIGFNGATAAKIGLAHLGAASTRYRLIRLPSSSAAHAVPFETKLATWRQLSVNKCS